MYASPRVYIYLNKEKQTKRELCKGIISANQNALIWSKLCKEIIVENNICSSYLVFWVVLKWGI